MEHNIYYERQCELIERAQKAEREREEFENYMRIYRRAKAYFRLQNTKRYQIVRDGKTRPSRKQRSAMTKCERQVYRTRRFENSYITVYCKGRPTA